MTTESPRTGLRRRGAARRQAMLAAATEVFLEKGFERTTLSDVLEKSGGSRSTLYALFGGKEGLFEAMLEENRAQIWEELDSATAGNLPPHLGLRRLGLKLLETLQRPQTASLLRIVLCEGRRFPRMVDNFFRFGPDALTRRLADYLRAVAPAHRLHADDAEALARAFLGMLHGDFVIRLLAGRLPHMDHDRLVAHVDGTVAAFLDGIRARD